MEIMKANSRALRIVQNMINGNLCFLICPYFVSFYSSSIEMAHVLVRFIRYLHIVFIYVIIIKPRRGVEGTEDEKKEEEEEVDKARKVEFFRKHRLRECKQSLLTIH